MIVSPRQIEIDSKLDFFFSSLEYCFSDLYTEKKTHELLKAVSFLEFQWAVYACAVLIKIQQDFA